MLHTYWRPCKFCFPFVSENWGGGGGEREGVKTPKFMTDIHKVLLKSSVFSLLLEELLKKCNPLTLKRCNNWTTKFDVTTFLSLNKENCNIQNYEIFLNTFVGDLI